MATDYTDFTEYTLDTTPSDWVVLANPVLFQVQEDLGAPRGVRLRTAHSGEESAQITSLLWLATHTDVAAATIVESLVQFRAPEGYGDITAGNLFAGDPEYEYRAGQELVGSRVFYDQWADPQVTNLELGQGAYTGIGDTPSATTVSDVSSSAYVWMRMRINKSTGDASLWYWLEGETPKTAADTPDLTYEWNEGAIAIESAGINLRNYVVDQTEPLDVFWFSYGTGGDAAPMPGGEEAPELSSPTPSGTLGTSTTASVGATTDTNTGTLYAVLSTSNNVSGASASQIKAGNNSGGTAATHADDAAISTTSPSVGFTGLTASTLYYYALVQNSAGGDSNVVSGSFTTAAAAIVATKLLITTQPANTVVGEAMANVIVEAVDGSDNLDTSITADATVALQTGSGTLAGTLTRAASGGVWTFSGLSIDTLNTGAVLRFTSSGLTQADSDTFNIVAGTGSGVGVPSTSTLGGALQCA